MTRKTKAVLMAAGVVAIALVMAAGDIVRSASGHTVGSADVLGQRLTILRNLSEYGDVSLSKAFGNAAGRMFFPGGHSVITRTPEEVPYVGFYPMSFAREAFLNVLPGFIIENISVSRDALYSGNFRLNDYDFLLTDEHQVGISMLGSIWVIGGWPYVIAGAIAIPLIHLLFVRAISRYQMLSPVKALWFASVGCVPFLWFAGENLLTSMRSLLWAYIVAWVSYQMLIKPLTHRLETQEQDAVRLPYLSESWEYNRHSG